MTGPNVRRLICHRTAQLCIPPNGGLADGLKALAEPTLMVLRAREATAWVEEAIATVKTSPDNPYADDEAIAGAILKGIEERRKCHAGGH